MVALSGGRDKLKMTTLHILSNPESPVHTKNRMDPFSAAVYKFIKNMSGLGWDCVHYGTAGCEVDCETVICLSKIGSDSNTNRFIYNKNAAEEIKKRKKPGDFILCFHGWGNQDATKGNEDLKIVEPSIGYSTSAIFAPYRVFVSYAQMHMFYGERGMLMNPSWFDSVIPNAFTPSEFDFNTEKEDYILYFGRVIETKGIHIAVQATEKTGQRLIIAGPGSLSQLGYSSIPSHITEVGLCDVEQRRKLMSGARAIIGPTYYVEPFGNMVIEGYFSGTPAITTDWGGFTETVEHGVTGFRCREMRDFIYAIENINQINPQDCLNWAERNCSEEIVHQKFDSYFKKLSDHNFYR